MAHTFKGIARDLSGRGKPPMQGRTLDVDDEKSSEDEGNITTKERDLKGPSTTVENRDAIKSE